MTLLKDIIRLIKQLPTETFDELSIFFLDPLKQYFHKVENFSSIIIELKECELKRILLELEK